MLTLERLLELAGLKEVDFSKLDKLHRLADHPNTPPHERAAALAAIKRLLPPRPPQPEAPTGGYVNHGKVFSPGPEIENYEPRTRSYTTARGKTFS